MTELDLYAENTSELYPRKKAILENIRRRLAKGTYDPALAPKLWMYWVDDAARRYVREFGTGDVASVFPRSTREAYARQLARRYASGHE